MRAWLRRTGLAVAVVATLSISGCLHGDVETAEEVVTEAAEPSEDQGTVGLREVGDFDQPLYVAQPPNSEDLYVVEKPGRVQLLRGGSGRAVTALEIRGEVADHGEQGLLSIAFAPDFESSRLVYAYFTDSQEDQRVVEYRVSNDGTFEEPSRREVLRMDDFAANHNGGLLLFGPDDLLYVGTGDGGNSGDPERNGQSLETLLGKLLRIDPRPADGRPYRIPPDNPFVDRPEARPEIYSYGLRNPWRFSFDHESGYLFIADVGQDRVEEVNALPLERARGANFGWSAYEGDERFNDDQQAPGHVPPVFTYPRGDRGCSITGGYVVRHPELPSLDGRYLYGDFCAGQLRSFAFSDGQARDDRALGPTVPALSSFAEDGDDRIYATSLDGPVFELVP